MRSLSMLLVLQLVVYLTHPILATIRPKLHIWFPKYEARWIERAAACQQELQDYLHDNHTSGCAAPCACAADCILKDLPPTIQSNFASAQVLLGLTPAILVYFGPTVAEVAALSTYRPLLAVLLSLGSPAISIVGVFRYVDLRVPFTQPLSWNAGLWSTWVGHRGVRTRGFVHVSSYVVTLAAIANNVHTSVHTDLRTISGWRCSAILMPLAWSLLAGVVHLWGMIAIRMRLGRGYRPSIRSATRSTTFLDVLKGADNVLSEASLRLSALCATIHMGFGILVLSSLIFISALEAIQTFVLYAISALMCHVVLVLELASMRYELSKNEETERSAGDVAKHQVALSRAHTL